MNWGALVLSLVITVIVYLLVPVILALAKKKFPQKRIKWIVIINCVVCWIIFQVLTIELTGESSTSAAVFIWGAVGYAILRKFCAEPERQEEDMPDDVVDFSKSEEKPAEISSSDAQVFTEISLSPLDEKPTSQGSHHIYGSDISLEKPNKTSIRGKSLSQNYATQPEVSPAPVIKAPTKQKSGVSKPAFVVVSCLCVAAIVCSCVFGYLYRKNYNIAVQNFDVVERLETEKSELKKTLAEKDSYNEKIVELESANAKLRSTNELLADRISELNESVAKNAEKAKICDDYLVFVPNGSNVYHKYDCDKWNGTGSVYATWQLDDLNLRACSYCH